MPIPQYTTGQLYLTVDQLLRRIKDMDDWSATDIGRKLYDQARPDTRGSLTEYVKIASDAIRQARAARDMEQNLDQTRTSLPPSTGLGAMTGQYQFNVVVEAIADDGTKMFSTSVHIESNEPLSARQVKAMAIAAIGQVPANYRNEAQGRQIARYETWIMLAGQL